MSIIPAYSPPDFTSEQLKSSPVVKTEPALDHGVVPANFHGTSNHPEYLHLGNGRWLLAPESRMDAVLVLKGAQGRHGRGRPDRKWRRGDLCTC